MVASSLEVDSLLIHRPRKRFRPLHGFESPPQALSSNFSAAQMYRSNLSGAQFTGHVLPASPLSDRQLHSGAWVRHSLACEEAIDNNTSTLARTDDSAAFTSTCSPATQHAQFHHAAVAAVDTEMCDILSSSVDDRLIESRRQNLPSQFSTGGDSNAGLCVADENTPLRAGQFAEISPMPFCPKRRCTVIGRTHVERRLVSLSANASPARLPTTPRATFASLTYSQPEPGHLESHYELF
ncbi:unnamed protein product [Protopolystoma xenopodis]|uniref:Uncharacterized protein n=1 Tax=Protopolystoma xenopodis TaxID=117903 RepID=A0A3S5CPP2_9PLAT|nr:unnamed protein product [Protopolystoma xenopodis]